MVNDKTRGERITLTLTVFDGAGAPLRDALVEIWQADAAGLYPSPAETRGRADPDFTGWGRCPADMDTGACVFRTIKPGRVPFPDGRLMAPHINLWIVARGINLGLHTRVYFPDEEEANAADPVLARIEHRARVATLDRPQGGGRLRLRRPSAGRQRNRLLRQLTGRQNDRLAFRSSAARSASRRRRGRRPISRSQPNSTRCSTSSAPWPRSRRSLASFRPPPARR